MLINRICANIKLIFLTILFLTACGGGGGTTLANGNSSLCSSVIYDAPSGAPNNIVFLFDKPYACGQFANGDWWVSKDSGGSVTITAITPNAGVGKNGFELNPSSTTQQAFDINAGVAYNPALMPSLPLTITQPSSVVKAVSITPISLPQLKFVAVLTVVDAPINNSSEVFRPGYFGTTKTFYNISAIRTANIPRYNATSLPSLPTLTFATIANRYRHVQLDHYYGWVGRFMHPMDNMPDYGAELATNSATSLLRILVSDFNYLDPTHKQALINYLQMAIDLQSMAIGGARWPADGGHGNGRKLPLIFAAWIFNDASFSNAVAVSEFSEDTQVWRSSFGTALFGRRGFAGVESEYWNPIMGLGGGSDIRDPYGYIDGGSAGPGDNYQFCCTSKPWKYTVLALYMLRLEAAWGNGNTLIDYVERWVNSGAKALPDICAPYDSNPANYGFTYGSNGPGSCILGGGRWPLKQGINVDGGFYGNTFGDNLWTWYKSLPLR